MWCITRLFVSLAVRQLKIGWNLQLAGIWPIYDGKITAFRLTLNGEAIARMTVITGHWTISTHDATMRPIRILSTTMSILCNHKEN